MSASNDQIYAAILALKGEVGGVRADVKNAHAFAASVSHKADVIREEIQKVDRKLDEHKEDTDAHGLKAERRGGRSALWIVGWAVGIIGGLAGVWSAIGVVAAR